MRLGWRVHVGWLVGCPTPDGRWLAVPERGALGEPVAVDGARLSTSLRALKIAIREDRASVEHRVGDVAAFLAKVERIVERLGAPGREGRPTALWREATLFPSRVGARAERLSRTSPAIASVVDALSWLVALEGDASAALQAIEDSARALQAIRAELGEEAALRLAIVRVRVDGSAPLIECLAEPSVHHTALDPEDQDDGRTPRRGSLGRRLVPWAEALLELAPRERRRALDTFARLDILPWIAEWRARAARVTRLEGAVRRRAAHLEALERERGHGQRRNLEAAKKALAEARTALEVEEDVTPPRLSPKRLVEALARAPAWDDATIEPVHRLLDALPSSAAGVPGGRRARLFVHMAEALTSELRTREARRAVTSLWRALADGIRDEPRLATLFAPLDERGLGAHQSPVDVDTGLAEEEGLRLAPEIVVALWRSLLERGISAQDDSPFLYVVLLYTLDPRPERAVERVARLVTDVKRQPRLYYWYRERPAVVLTLAGDDDERFVQLFERVPDDGRIFNVAFVDAMRSAGLGDVLDEALDHGPVERVAGWALLVAALGGRVPVATSSAPGATRAWIARHPEALHAALHALADVEPDAELVAEKIIGTVVRTRHTIETELAAVEARLARGGPRALALRASSLRRALERPPTVRASALEKLAVKLRRAAKTRKRDAFEARLEVEAEALARRDLGLAETPSWWTTPIARRIYVAVRALEAPFQALGLAVLARRHGPPPWHFREHPANVAFLERLVARGIDPAPWLASGATTDEATGLTLALEDDSLEIFQMGEHFKTCLSLERENFFSTVVNALDVNKRVLFARARDGRVAGRCLLALTDEGELLTFHAYAHEGGEAFAGLVAAFVRDLATKMGARIAPRGTVRALVAPRWYDDGPHDLASDERILREDARFSRALREGQAEAAIERARELVRFDATTAAIILGMVAPSKHPELVRAVLDVPGVVDRLDPYVLLALAAALETTSPALALELVSRPSIDRYLRAACPNCGGRCYHQHTPEALGVLARLDPSRLLHIVRTTTRPGRPPSPVQAEAAAIALERLHRPAQAARMRAFVTT